MVNKLCTKFNSVLLKSNLLLQGVALLLYTTKTTTSPISLSLATTIDLDWEAQGPRVVISN